MITPGRVGQLITLWLIVNAIIWALAEMADAYQAKTPDAGSSQTPGVNNDSEV